MYNYSSLVPLKSALSVHSLGKYYTGAVMGIGHIFKIDVLDKSKDCKMFVSMRTKKKQS
jgi:hypothetical protein